MTELRSEVTGAQRDCQSSDSSIMQRRSLADETIPFKLTAAERDDRMDRKTSGRMDRRSDGPTKPLSMRVLVFIVNR